MGEEQRRHLLHDGRRYAAKLLDGGEHGEIALAGDLGLPADEAVHQHQSLEARRCQPGQLHAPHATDGEPHQHELIHAEGIEQGQVIPGQGRQGAGPFRQRIGVAVPPQLGHYAAVLPLEGGHLRRPHGTVPQIAVAKQQDRALALVQIGQLTTCYLHQSLHVFSCCRQTGRQCSTTLLALASPTARGRRP
ncbi:hypothetical protein D3C80_1308140 [compost metagenome]